MPKSERLFQMVELLSDRKGSTVEEIARQVGISVRTAYRYLATLNQARVPVEFDGRYSIENKKKHGRIPLSTDQLEMLRFCVYNNPLVEYPYFRKEAGRIKSVLDKLATSSDSSVRALRASAPPRNKHRQLSKPPWCTSFTKAVKNKQMVRLRVKSERTNGSTVIPVVLSMTPKGPCMIVQRNNGRQAAILADDIVDMQLLRTRFRESDLSPQARRLTR